MGGGGGGREGESGGEGGNGGEKEREGEAGAGVGGGDKGEGGGEEEVGREEEEKKSGGNWKSCDTRELFYSFHRDDVHAEAVMHKCVVHYVPQHKQLPKRKDHPGFIVQKVYDNVEKKLWRLGDKGFEDIKQQEIDVLLEKTLQRIGELFDIEADETLNDGEDQMKIKKSSRRISVSPLDVSKDQMSQK